MTREEVVGNIKKLNAVCWQKDFYDEEFAKSLALAIRSLEAWDEVLKDVQDWQDDFNRHVKLLALTDEEKEGTMAYGEDVVNIIGNHMVELKEVEK